MEAPLSNKDKYQIIEEFFTSKPERISAGEVLLSQNEENRRLFYVVEGLFQGFLPDEQVQDPVFEATTGSIFGVYSFFSGDHRSYTEVRAVTDAAYIYYDEDSRASDGEQGQLFQRFLMDLIIGELKNRQHFAGRMARERQNSLRKLIKTEKMAVLGQMAAGLAHELNNAIGSLSSNLQSFKSRFVNRLESEQKGFFLDGCEQGRSLSTKQARENRRQYEQLKGLRKDQVKELAALSVDPGQVSSVLKRGGLQSVDDMVYCRETGALIRDMEIASKHASHVVKSVKVLGVANQNWSDDVDINQSIQEALVILTSLVKKVDLRLDLEDDLPHIQGSPGELMQVWINLVKNAIEALEINRVINPQVSVRSKQLADHIEITIADNGVGIPEKIQRKIFLPDFTTKVGGLSFGLGLGLPIVQRIVSEHYGSLSLSSEPGETIFSITFPVNSKTEQ